MDLLRPVDWNREQWAEWDRAIDREAARVALGGKTWFTNINVEHVRGILHSPDYSAYRVGAYVVIFTFGVPWFNPELRYFEELMVMRVGEGGSFRCVPESMLAVAKAGGCTHIVVGDALTEDKRLERVYNRYGFVTEASSMIRSL